MANGLVPLPLPLPLPDKEEEAAADDACCWKKLPISFPNEERASRPLLRSGPEVRVLAGLLPLLPLPLLLRLRSKEAAVVAAVILALVLVLEALVLVLAEVSDIDKGSSVAATGCLGGALIVGVGGWAWAGWQRLERKQTLPVGTWGCWRREEGEKEVRDVVVLA